MPLSTTTRGLDKDGICLLDEACPASRIFCRASVTRSESAWPHVMRICSHRSNEAEQQRTGYQNRSYYSGLLALDLFLGRREIPVISISINKHKHQYQKTTVPLELLTDPNVCHLSSVQYQAAQIMTAPVSYSSIMVIADSKISRVWQGVANAPR